MSIVVHSAETAQVLSGHRECEELGRGGIVLLHDAAGHGP